MPVRCETGFSLLEVMIAVLVLSVGILGMATLQLQALKSNQSALSSTEATQYANLMGDLMRANRSAALAGQYNIALGERASGATAAVADLQYWKQTLGSLPQGDGAVVVSQGRATISVQWQGGRQAGEPAQRVLVVRTEL
ncbi:MAG: type IV pilus modification protein PilV [Aeromonas sp.]|uniref:type IV pilus modification protein PilV n=1 Tax=Aeromonas sp. TaxID=647 RepID=UPI002FC6FE2C